MTVRFPIESLFKAFGAGIIVGLIVGTHLYTIFVG